MAGEGLGWVVEVGRLRLKLCRCSGFLVQGLVHRDSIGDTLV